MLETSPLEKEFSSSDIQFWNEILSAFCRCIWVVFFQYTLDDCVHNPLLLRAGSKCC
jgi:hypothetical protein